jgi:hypothetical protein
VFVSTEDAASGKNMPDAQKGLERARGLKDFSQTFRTNYELYLPVDTFTLATLA